MAKRILICRLTNVWLQVLFCHVVELMHLFLKGFVVEFVGFADLRSRAHDTRNNRICVGFFHNTVFQRLLRSLLLHGFLKVIQ